MSIPAVAAEDDTILLRNHALSDSANKISYSSKERMEALAKSIKRLENDALPGIFVRHGVSRLDVMKIIILGAEGTPYENGLFEFDLLCGPKFPQDPPTMAFRTTNRGTTEFNPNLYKCGKVCLSLLGTWEGMGWNEGHESSISQVLLSIQSFILCSEPYFNEPWTKDYKHQGLLVSKSYNRWIYLLTMKLAMVDWIEGRVYTTTLQRSKGETLSSPEYHIWDRVISAHFASNKQQILETTDRWMKSSPAYTEGDVLEGEELTAKLKEAAKVMEREDWPEFHPQ